MQVEVGMTFKMGYAFTEIYRRPAYGAVHIISFFQKEFGKKRTVLPCNTCN